MNHEEIDWDSGTVVFWDLGFLSPTTPLADQVVDLKEDLAQIAYSTNVLLDVGWYPEFSSDGAFAVRVVSPPAWDEPLFQETTTSVRGLLECLQRAIRSANANSLRRQGEGPL